METVLYMLLSIQLTNLELEKCAKFHSSISLTSVSKKVDC